MIDDPHTHSSRRRGRVSAVIVTTALLVSIVAWQGAGPAHATTTPIPYRPDAWVKLCGLSTGCTINPLPHPWKGKDVYNSSGANQKIAVRLDDGEDVRFWLTLENDAEADDTLIVDGCKGTHLFQIIAVKVGFLKRPDWRPLDITAGFKNGTATFDFPPASQGKTVGLTLAFIAPTTAEGVSYRCPVTIRSQSDPTVSDTLVVKMTTY
jgi:hypothetical protein